MKKHGPILAFDRQSVRSYDADGRLHVALTNISKANVCPYYGSEIPGFVELGLEPTKVYKLWRDPDELAKGAATFNNLPLLRRHIQVSADEPSKDDVVGSIGSDVTFNSPYLCASLCIWDSEAIAGIEAEKIEELSSAYRYNADMTPGATPDGEAYDGRMTNIIGNHLALVEVGRAGSDVVVADHNPFTPKQEIPAMKYTKLGLALKVALSAASPKIAQDSGLPALVGKATAKAFKKDEVRAKLVAMDGDMDNQQLDDIIGAILGVEQTPEPEVPMTGAADEDDDGAGSKHAEIIDFLKSKGLDASDLEAVGNMLTRMDKPEGADELPDDVMTKEEADTAMDAMRSDMLKQFRDLDVAKSAVRSVVGEVIGMDSAESVYRFALDHLKVDHKETPAAGLRNLFSVASSVSAPKTPVIASDSAITASIPGLDRFSR
jgi:hypothetical protein